MIAARGAEWSSELACTVAWTAQTEHSSKDDPLTIRLRMLGSLGNAMYQHGNFVDPLAFAARATRITVRGEQLAGDFVAFIARNWRS